MKLSWQKGLERIRGRLGRYGSVLLVLAAGVLLLLLPLGGGGEEQAPVGAAAQEEAFSLEEFEEKLGETLSQIQGAGETQVVLSLDRSSRQVLAQDTQQGADGEESASTVTLGRGSAQQEVVPLQTVAPRFRGALVVCAGGDDPQVRLQVTQAVSALTGLGSDRISVCPRQK